MLDPILSRLDILTPFCIFISHYHVLWTLNRPREAHSWETPLQAHKVPQGQPQEIEDEIWRLTHLIVLKSDVKRKSYDQNSFGRKSQTCQKTVNAPGQTARQKMTIQKKKKASKTHSLHVFEDWPSTLYFDLWPMPMTLQSVPLKGDLRVYDPPIRDLQRKTSEPMTLLSATFEGRSPSLRPSTLRPSKEDLRVYDSPICDLRRMTFESKTSTRWPLTYDPWLLTLRPLPFDSWPSTHWPLTFEPPNRLPTDLRSCRHFNLPTLDSLIVGLRCLAVFRRIFPV